MKYFEDFHVDDIIHFGKVTIDAEEVMAFGRRYDPQPFHTDPAAAEKSAFGGLIASGWQTNAMLTALMVERMHSENWASLGSPGIKRCDWPRPVFVGDILEGTGTILTKRRSKSQPKRGLISLESRFENQNGDIVMRMHGIGFYACRPELSCD